MSEPVAQMLERLAALEKRATPAPWVTNCGDDEYCSSIAGILTEAEQRRIEADTRQYRGDFPEDTKWVVVDPGCAPVQYTEEENWEFIAALRNAAPRLLALVRCAEAVVDEARDADEDWTDLHTLIREYDEASRGAGQRGEGTNG